MELVHPTYLLALLLLPLLWLLFRSRRRGGGGILHFTDFAGMRRAADSRWRICRFFDVLAFVLLVVAFARPVSLDRVITPPVEGKDIVIALDVSGSMEALDFQPKNRIAAAKGVIEQFVRERRSDRLGLVFFAKESFLQVPLTTDYTMFVNLLQRLTTGVIDDGTAIGNGLGLALSRLEDSKAKSRLVILLTDGDNNSGNVSPEATAEIAKKLGIKIYTILIGTNKPVPFPAGKDLFGRDAYQTVTMKVNPDLLKRIADTTGGRAYTSISTDELRRAFTEIDKLEKSPVPAQKYKLYDEFAPYFIALALLLILLGRLFALLFPLYPEVER